MDNYVKILSDTFENNINNDDIDDELSKAIEALNLPNMMQIKEFLTIPEENIIYKVSNISKFADMFKNGPTNHPDKIDDSIEICINNTS
ncbi:hypothetical protein RhiirA5_434422 [Rhizophagus irregularis]|uniref:Uncharacterized protein n=2 Tax=Rhizophagus irregularis TaxID=588596 RepID=A0A2N0NQ31_9GLOM|nr:hypothetical protein RhiirA5_434422 [Rhizophagus irregularis]GET62864.1 hypothetical protein GLOIN_2v1771578 [Rhizophagus irregularis DAOM 181602=DAOM 197198]CAB5370307.1 unnamed protein product [Rhizophagus irregularis]